MAGSHTLTGRPADWDAASLEAPGPAGASAIVAVAGRGAAAALWYPPPLPPGPCSQQRGGVRTSSQGPKTYKQWQVRAPASHPQRFSIATTGCSATPPFTH